MLKYFRGTRAQVAPPLREGLTYDDVISSTRVLLEHKEFLPAFAKRRIIKILVEIGDIETPTKTGYFLSVGVSHSDRWEGG